MIPKATGVQGVDLLPEQGLWSSSSWKGLRGKGLARDWARFIWVTIINDNCKASHNSIKQLYEMWSKHIFDLTPETATNSDFLPRWPGQTFVGMEKGGYKFPMQTSDLPFLGFTETGVFLPGQMSSPMPLDFYSFAVTKGEGLIKFLPLLQILWVPF